MSGDNKEIGRNVKVFEHHLAMGLGAAGEDIMEFCPLYVTNKESGALGFMVAQTKYDADTICICFEDGLHFGPDMTMIPITKDQPASVLAVLVLGHVLSGNPMQPPACTQCEGKGAS